MWLHTSGGHGRLLLLAGGGKVFRQSNCAGRLGAIRARRWVSEGISGRLLRLDAAAVGLLGRPDPASAIAGVGVAAHGPPRLVPGAQRGISTTAPIDLRPAGSNHAARPG